MSLTRNVNRRSARSAPSDVSASERAAIAWRRFTPVSSESDKGQKRRRYVERTLRWTMPFVLLGLWQFAANQEWLDPRYFPGPAAIWKTARDLVESGRLQDATWVTMRRVLWGFVLGSALGFVLGVLLGVSRLARAAFEPIVYGFFTVPKLAILPLLLLVFGFGEKPIIALVVLSTLFLVLIPTMVSIASVPMQYRETAKSFNVSRFHMFWHVLFPACLPDLFVSLRLSISASVLVVVGAEFVNGSAGLGHLIWNSWTVFLPKPMYVGIVAVAILGTFLGLGVSAIGRFLVPWAEHD